MIWQTKCYRQTINCMPNSILSLTIRVSLFLFTFGSFKALSDILRFLMIMVAGRVLKDDFS